MMQPQSPEQAIPLHTPGMRIGLLGGSFNPPHAAHRAISLFALKRLQLDRVWWLVTPGNPLKDASALRDLSARLDAARCVAADARIDVTAVETVLRTRYTVDTLRALHQRCRGVRFVWIMGADNLAQFHRWQNWRGIADTMPIAVIDRPPQGGKSVSGNSVSGKSVSGKALGAPAAQAMARFRVPERDASRLADIIPPAWTFLSGLKLDVSSTGLRNPDGTWKQA